ncbi:hypothetical protein RHSIM_Rhsim03G0132100 [Rhododendron simsii]|uniref:Uncharacterized protein n=1 Tax=Rhododendron simsii TaxID=118357 RepID=A0A834LR85_RHOSS|nr:hypothetical protein RHSIM_Rhsim03G0132100 [Rhododendron simsii]
MNFDPKSNHFSEVPCTSQISELSNPLRQFHLSLLDQETLKLNADCDQPQQVSIPISIEHSTGEELSDSEDELLEVLEGVVSSKQEVEALSQPKAAVSLVKPHSELENFPTPEPPDLLDPGVKGESAILYSNGDAVFNKHLSKSTKRCLRKQAKEASFSALSSGRN